MSSKADSLMTGDKLTAPNCVRNRLTETWCMTKIVGPINAFLLMRLVSSADSQQHYHEIDAAGDRRALLRTGILRDKLAMKRQLSLWNVLVGTMPTRPCCQQEKKSLDRQKRSGRNAPW